MNADNINSVLDALAARFGATGAHLWAAIVRQVYVHAVMNMLVALICGAVVLYFLRKRAALHEWYDKSIDAEMGVGAAYIVAFVSAIVGLFNLFGIARIFNPEFYALQYVLEVLKP